MTALPVPESRLTIMRTVAPLVIIWSAMVWNWVLSPWAFWMSYWTPAALNASSRYLRSAVSHRTEDALSGRMTPIFGVFSGGAAPVAVVATGGDAEGEEAGYGQQTDALAHRLILSVSVPPLAARMAVLVEVLMVVRLLRETSLVGSCAAHVVNAPRIVVSGNVLARP